MGIQNIACEYCGCWGGIKSDCWCSCHKAKDEGDVMDTYKLSVRLPTDVADALRLLSNNDQRSIQTLAVRAITAYLKRRGMLREEAS